MQKKSLFLSIGFLLALNSIEHLVANEPNHEGIEFFERNIRPVLVNNCYKCHSTEARNLKGNLFLDSKLGILNGGDSGPAIIAGKPDESILLSALQHQDTLKMPPKNKMPDGIIANFSKWILMGAPDPRIPIKNNLIKSKIDLKEGRNFWSFIKPSKNKTPTVKNKNWPKNDIDRFILSKLESNELTPSRAATKRELIRRIYYDLTGLPPTPKQVAEFLKDNSENAFEKIVDKLLRSRHFGEHWGRHWLDVARYSESNGMERNFTYPHAWRYRDYVIDSFNQDKSFKQFIREQVAGDLLSRKKRKPTNDELIATGFLALGPKPLNQGNKMLFKLDVIDEQIDATTRAFLGLTVSCARCHDHKFDPIPTKDYYAIAGIFRSTDTKYGTVNGQGNRQPSKLLTIASKNNDEDQKIRDHNKKLEQENARLLLMQEERREIRALKKKADSNQKARMRKLNRDIKDLQTNIKNLESQTPTQEFAMGVKDGRISNAKILIRGEIRNQGETVKRGFLQVLNNVKSYPIGSASSGRLQLASWISHPDNPLTARVISNRIWHHLFGSGIVRTVDNFGATGDLPSHPELLDHLALTFTENNWSIKSLIRKIVLSRTYQLSSEFNKVNFKMDPENRLFWRMNHKRLNAETFRDAILSTSGQLNRQPANGSIVAKLGDVDVARALRQFRRTQRETGKRSVYLPILRNSLPEMMRIFDAAEPSLIVGKRNQTTVPTQALYLMNSQFINNQAANMARRVANNAKNKDDRIKFAYNLAFSRLATIEEISNAKEFLNKLSLNKNTNEQWAMLCQALLASAEFRYIE